MPRLEGIRVHLTKIVTMAKAGLTLQQIGNQFGVTRERIRQILKGEGISRHERGCAKRSQFRDENRRKVRTLRKDARTMKYYGCSHAEMIALNGCCASTEGSLASLYFQQKHSASWREIEFTISFPDWLSIWRESGHLDERGRGKGKYVMSRFNDVGPYAVGNVYIQLATDNSGEAMRRSHALGKFHKPRQVVSDHASDMSEVPHPQIFDQTSLSTPHNLVAP